MAVGSGALIGLTIVLIDAAPDDSGLIPLLANRIVSTFSLALAIVVVIGARSLRGTSPRLPGLRTIPSVWIMVVVAGILDVIANVAVLYGLRTGALTVMAVLVALYPAGTIVLAGLWLKERVAAIQWVGLALALIASALLAL
jgi:drug/metabolite transporter (DMT)-like permease